MSSPEGQLYQTAAEAVTEEAFYGVLWMGVSLCALMCALRSYIRLHYFRRLQADDYLMLLALMLFIAVAIVGQLFLRDIYLLEHVELGLVQPPLDFLNRMAMGLKAAGIIIGLVFIGVWLIKLNFLLFFWRISHQLIPFLVFWWISFVLVCGCGIAALAIGPWACFFGGSMTNIVQGCGSEDGLRHFRDVYRVSVVVDCCSDAIILCFPITILWKAGISLRQKLILSSIFCLVGFTIAATIIRGSIFGGVYTHTEHVDRRVIDTIWVQFWFVIEYIVSFIVACLISYRSLWTRRGDRARREEARLRKREEQQSSQPSARQSSFRSRMQNIHDSLLDTFNEEEY